MGSKRLFLLVFVAVSISISTVAMAAVSKKPADYRTGYLTEASPDSAR